MINQADLFILNDIQSIIQGDCIEAMQTMADNSIDFIVTDPPYGLHFMNKDWDHGIPGMPFWGEALRVCKPGSMLAAFGGTRTFHRLTCAIEDAGWEIRDCISWLYGSGFTKSHNHFGLPGYGTALKPSHEPVIIARKMFTQNQEQDIIITNLIKLWCRLCLMLPVNVAEQIFMSNNLDMSAVLDFAQWNAEKKSNIQADLCALMDISQLEKVLISCLNIVSSWKITLEDHWKGGSMSTISTKTNPTIDLRILKSYLYQLTPLVIIQAEIKQPGSWLNALPAARYLNAVSMSINAIQELSVLENVIEKDGLNLCPNWEPIILAMKPLEGTFAQNAEKWGLAGINIDDSRIGIDEIKTCAKEKGSSFTHLGNGEGYNGCQESIHIGRWPANLILSEEAAELLDRQSGKGASRFFYCAKASSSERNRGLEGFPLKKPVGTGRSKPDIGRQDPKSYLRENSHPTVKPIALMKYIIKLLAPPGYPTLLDPFAGSGSTIVAAKELGINAIGIELSEEYCAIARKRTEKVKLEDQSDL